MDQPVPDVTRADVERVVRRDFAPGDQGTALGILEGYSDREPHRVHLAALKMSDGNLEELRQWTQVAVSDFRDILLAAEYPHAAKKWTSLDKASEEARRKIYEADWRQYQTWLTRP